MRKREWVLLGGIFLLVFGVAFWFFRQFQTDENHSTISLGSKLKTDVSGSTAAGADSTLSFEPTSKSLKVGDSFSLDVKIDPGENQVTAVDLEINYPKTTVECQSLTADGSQWTTLTAGVLDNTSGKATIALGVLTSVGKITSPTKVANFELQD